MKLDHLTFGQLYKLKSPETLMRVTQAYHKALRRKWDAEIYEWCSFFVARAEETFPAFSEPWRRVIQFLCSAELKSALRKSAVDTRIPPSCYVSALRVLPNRGFPNATIRKSLAAAIVAHCEANCVPACVMDFIDRTIVYAATDSMGCAVLESKPGLPWADIEKLCYQLNVCVDRIFWWLPEGDRTGWRVNPMNWPVNTPDVQEAAKELVTY